MKQVQQRCKSSWFEKKTHEHTHTLSVGPEHWNVLCKKDFNSKTVRPKNEARHPLI